MKKKRLLIAAAFLVGVVVIVLILFYSAPTTIGDLHYYHHDLTETDADNGLGFDYGKSDEHITVSGWRTSFEKRLSKDTALLADWYYLLVKDYDIEKAAREGNALEDDLVADAELRQTTYEEVCEKLDGATIEKVRWNEGAKYLTGIMTPEAPTDKVPVLDSKQITTTTPLTLMAIYTNPSKNGDGTLTAYCIPGCGDQPAEPVGKVKETVVSRHNPKKPIPTPWNPDPDPDPDPKPDPGPDPGPTPDPDEPNGCSDDQTWEPSDGQPAEKYTDDPTGGGNGHRNTDDPLVPGTDRKDEDPRIGDGWTTEPDVPATPPEVGGGGGRVSGDD